MALYSSDVEILAFIRFDLTGQSQILECSANVVTYKQEKTLTWHNRENLWHDQNAILFAINCFYKSDGKRTTKFEASIQHN